MGSIQKTLIFLVAALLLAVSLLTWGSIGSVLCMFLLLIMGGMLLYRWFQDTHDPDDYPMGNQ